MRSSQFRRCLASSPRVTIPDPVGVAVGDPAPSRADKVGPQLGKGPLAILWKSLEQFFRRYQGEDRVSQKLQLLIVATAARVARLRSILFARVRAVSQRQIEQVRPDKRVAKDFH